MNGLVLAFDGAELLCAGMVRRTEHQPLHRRTPPRIGREGEQARVRTRPQQGDVEGGVELKIPAAIRHGMGELLIKQGAGAREVSIGQPRHGKLEGSGLQEFLDLGRFEQVIPCRAEDFHPAMRGARGETLPHQLGEGFAYRSGRHVELAGHVVLLQPRTGRDAPGQDLLTQLAGEHPGDRPRPGTKLVRGHADREAVEVSVQRGHSARHRPSSSRAAARLERVTASLMTQMLRSLKHNVNAIMHNRPTVGLMIRGWQPARTLLRVHPITGAASRDVDFHRRQCAGRACVGPVVDHYLLSEQNDLTSAGGSRRACSAAILPKTRPSVRPAPWSAR